MFGLSPGKLLFTVLIVAAVWYGFKWLNRYQAQQKKSAKGQGNGGNNGSQGGDNPVEDLVACEKCGDYVISDKKSGCGKTGCPYER